MEKIKIGKQFIIILLSILLLNGCSFSSPTVKYSTYIGLGSGVILGAVLGSEIGGTHMGGGSGKPEAALTVGILFAAIGALFGAGTGYMIDALTEDKEIKDIHKSHLFIEEK